MNSKFLGIAVLSAAGCLAAGSYVALRILGHSRPRFPYMATAASESFYRALACKPGWAQSRLEVARNTHLRGLIRLPSNPQQDWVLYYPGNDETQLATGQLFLEGLAQSNDLGLAVFAYRGFDGSDGKPNYTSLVADAPRILNGLCNQQQVEPKRVHVVGFSIGSHLALIAARAAHLAKHPVKSLSLLACVNDISMLHRSPWERFSLGDHYVTGPILGDVPAPILLLQGSRDEALRGPKQALAVARVLGDRAEYQEFEGVGHEALLWHDPAVARLREFVLSR